MILTNKQAIYVIKDGHDEEGSTPEVARTAPMTSQRPVRKYVIICVTCLAIAALLVIGAVVAVKLITDTQRDILKYDRHTKAGDRAFDESIFRQSPDNNSLLYSYHVSDPSGESWGITDYSRKLMVIKFELEPGTFVCYIIMNEPEIDTSLSQVDGANEAAAQTEGEDVTYIVRPVKFNVSSEQLDDTSSILGPIEQALCADADVFLVDSIIFTDSDKPASKSDSSTVTAVQRPERGSSRQKRQFVCAYATGERSRCAIGVLKGDTGPNAAVFWRCPKKLQTTPEVNSTKTTLHMTIVVSNYLLEKTH